jgi:hypothetical protein
MYKRLDRAHHAMSLVLGVLTLVSLGLLLAWNVNPKFFPIRAHGFLAAFPLAMIAIAYLLYQSAHRLSAKELLKAMMLAVACQSTLARFTPSDYLQRHCHCALRPRYLFGHSRLAGDFPRRVFC